MELNPNHEVTRTLHDQWHKIVAVLMAKYGMSEVMITLDDIERVSGKFIVAEGRKENILLRLVTEEEGKALAKKAGGLPS